MIAAQDEYPPSGRHHAFTDTVAPAPTFIRQVLKKPHSITKIVDAGPLCHNTAGAPPPANSRFPRPRLCPTEIFYEALRFFTL